MYLQLRTFLLKPVASTTSTMEIKPLFLLLVLVLVVLSSSSVTVACSVEDLPGIFTFGDSVLDAGNNHFNRNCTVQADFPPYGSTFFHHPTGRFTNGRTVVDFISQYIGIGFQKPYAEAHIDVLNGSSKAYPCNGINFASAGSGVLQATNENWSGSNDIFDYFLPFDTPKLDPDAYVQTMLTQVAEFMDQLYKLGARKIVLVSLGPVGCVPARALLPGAPIDQCHEKMNVMVKNYNKGLETLVNNVSTKYHSFVGVYGAVYDIVQRFRAIPTRYGFSDVTSACCGHGTLGGLIQCGKEGSQICSKPNEYLFWDLFHPSEHTYKLISKALWKGNKFQIRPINLKSLVNMTHNYSFLSAP